MQRRLRNRIKERNEAYETIEYGWDKCNLCSISFTRWQAALLSPLFSLNVVDCQLRRKHRDCFFKTAKVPRKHLATNFAALFATTSVCPLLVMLCTCCLLGLQVGCTNQWLKISAVKCAVLPKYHFLPYTSIFYTVTWIRKEKRNARHFPRNSFSR